MYKFKSLPFDFYKKQEAEIIGKHLRQIEDKNGHITPQLIIQEAKHVKHPLHPCFEWKDTVAAQKWRETQARSMLRVLVVQDEHITDYFRAFVNVQIEKEHIWMNIQSVMSDQDLMNQQLEECKRDIERLIKKWNHLKDIGQIFATALTSFAPQQKVGP